MKGGCRTSMLKPPQKFFIILVDSKLRDSYYLILNHNLSIMILFFHPALKINPGNAHNLTKPFKQLIQIFSCTKVQIMTQYC
jgi:hypothetical protein